jgi:prepilin-type N-terminal cleavage/methylation domain-containing protein
MRASRGFTLVELMIVVAIIGLLSAIAIPSFGRYIKRARTAEVPEYMHKIIGGATVYYEADHADSATVLLPRQFPDTTTKEKDCCLYPTLRCDPGAPQYQRVEWRALGFTITTQHYFRPDLYSAGTDQAATFTIEVYGDLDCDGIWSTYSRAGAIDATDGTVASSGGTAIFNDLE